MHRPKVGERIILELLASGESYPSEVQAVDDSVMQVTPAMRGPDLPEPGGAVRITFVRKDGIYEEHGTVAEISRESEIVLTLPLAGRQPVYHDCGRRPSTPRSVCLPVGTCAEARRRQEITKRWNVEALERCKRSKPRSPPPTPM